MSEEVEQSQSTPESKQEQEQEQSTQAGAFTPKKLKESFTSLPTKISEDIDNGKGDILVTNIQSSISGGIQSIFSSCRIIILQQLLLSKEARKNVSVNIYLTAAILCGIITISLILSFDLLDVVLLGETILTAFIADQMINKSQTKPNQKDKKLDEDDYL